MRNRKWASYEEYLASEEWAKIRGMALDRAKHRCQVCNSDIKLHVHHRVYDAAWGNESTNDLIALCQSCHMLFHRNEARIKKINKLEKKLIQQKKSEADRVRRIKMKASPSYAHTVRNSGAVRTFTKEEIAAYAKSYNIPKLLP